MVRKGSPVRVRQRALGKPAACGGFLFEWGGLEVRGGCFLGHSWAADRAVRAQFRPLRRVRPNVRHACGVDVRLAEIKLLAEAPTVAALLDQIPGAYERAQLGREQAAAGQTVPLAELQIAD